MNTPDHIDILEKDSIFVFGSNMNGSHGGGAALKALEFGAVDRQYYGLQGQSFAIPTLDRKYQKLPLLVIHQFLELFTWEAYRMPEKIFFLTKIGLGIAGFSLKEIKSILPKFPKNVVLPIEFEK